MRKFVGWFAAIIVWILTIGVFLLMDCIFHISATHKLYAAFGFGVPTILAWIAFHIAPDILLALLGKMLELLDDLFYKIRNRNGKEHADIPAAKTPNDAAEGQGQVCIPKVNRTDYKNDTSNRNNRDKSYYASFPVVLEGYPLVYYYRNIEINALDSALFDSMVRDDDYSISVVPDQAGGAVIQKDGKTLGTISKYGSMIDDWQKRGEPMLCKITSLKEGRESVGLGFYRDMQAKLSSCEHSVVRLTKNRSQDMQDAVAPLEDGEMLDIFPEYMNEEDAIPVQSKIWGEVGFLPKKFNKIYEETGIRGVFVDHVEEDENFKYTAYVRVYW